MRASILGVSLIVLAASAHGAGCETVVADTVEEIRAGAAGWWSEDAERLVRAAAGSACIKAQSGRYTDAAAGAAAPAAQVVQEDTLAAAGDRPKKTTGSDPAADEAANESDGGDGSFTFGGLTFRSLSGSPGKKPYERTRGNVNSEGGEGSEGSEGSD